jgi:two-component system, OmpR family, phosphate regulon sensor histidine kinase PhoR
VKSHDIRLLIIFGVMTLVGIITFQVYWVKKTYDIRESHFNQAISVALFDVAVKIAEFNESILQVPTPVHQLSSNYFVVEVNDIIDKKVLELFLRREFDKRGLSIDFEYAIFDCHENEMVFGRYVNMGDPSDTVSSGHEFALCENCTYYFGIHFPTIRSEIIGTMNVWFISSAILLSAIIFFGWSLYLVFRQKRLSEIQRDFINNMTHEFKTPITTIGISAEVLLKDDMPKDPARVRNYLKIIGEQNERLREQVEKVLQAANIEKRKLRLEKEDLDISDILLTVCESYHPMARERGGSVITITDRALSGIHADRFHLTNIMMNLTDNALKYSIEGPAIRLEAVRTPTGMYLSVSDNGIGIEKKYRKKVFDRFFRVPTGALHNVKGFGLGLHYVYNAVRAHGWHIHLESEVGRGSTFRILIPQHHLANTPSPANT